MTSIPSTNPSPWSQDDKFLLNEVCLRSFFAGFSDVDTSVHVLLDYCSEAYDEMVKRVLGRCVIEHTELGINGTMLRSYELALDAPGYVLFQECDYLYRPQIGKLYMDALGKLDIVSPYDHRNFYIDGNIHNPTCELALVGDYHFRSTERNTMTWATHADIVSENIDTFVRYGYLDDLVWTDLLMNGRRLWTPIPSFATHCVNDYLAPGIDWSELWNRYRSV